MGIEFIYPKPREWNTFEDIVCDVFARKYNNLNFQRYGRNGQRQSGVDIAGPTDRGILGIQCKHHPEKPIEKTEIATEITLSDCFTPTLCEFIIATSTDRDTNIHNYTLQISEERQKQGKYPVSIKFWDDILNWLTEYPDLLYKYFTKYFPGRELEDIYLPDLEKQNKKTLSWPTTKEELILSINETIGSIKKVDPYQVAIGVTNFPDVSFRRKVDIELQLSNLYANGKTPEESFNGGVEALRTIRTVLNDPFFSKEIIVYPQVRLSLAFLIGWTFRHVSGYKILVKSYTQFWATEGLPFIPPGLIDAPPVLMNTDSRDAVIVFNISRDITKSVVDFINPWINKPYCILPISLEGFLVTSAAHAASLAHDLSKRLKSLVDTWGIKRIHLFTAMPAALAVLVGHNLNAICPICIYFMNDARTDYVLGGTLENNL